MKVVKVDPQNIDAAVVSEAAKVLREGGLVALPTETVYGIAANALDPEAVAKVYLAKRRSRNKPLAVCVASREQAEALAEGVTAQAKRLMDKFWPGPLTLVLRRKAVVPDIVTAGTEMVALRCPEDAVAQAVLSQARIPVVLTSANLSGAPSATTAGQVVSDLGERVDFVLDGGPTQLQVASTVLDLTVTPPALLREGAIPRSRLSQFLG
jgi:L-threonylcarbamoyladenylate synthase